MSITVFLLSFTEPCATLSRPGSHNARSGASPFQPSQHLTLNGPHRGRQESPKRARAVYESVLAYAARARFAISVSTTRQGSPGASNAENPVWRFPSIFPAIQCHGQNSVFSSTMGGHTKSPSRSHNALNALVQQVAGNAPLACYD